MKTYRKLMEEIANVVGEPPGFIAGVSDNEPPIRSKRKSPMDEDETGGDVDVTTGSFLHGGTATTSQRRRLLTHLMSVNAGINESTAFNVSSTARIAAQQIEATGKPAYIVKVSDGYYKVEKLKPSGEKYVELTSIKDVESWLKSLRESVYSGVTVDKKPLSIGSTDINRLNRLFRQYGLDENKRFNHLGEAMRLMYRAIEEAGFVTSAHSDGDISRLHSSDTDMVGQRGKSAFRIAKIENDVYREVTKQIIVSWIHTESGYGVLAYIS